MGLFTACLANVCSAAAAVARIADQAGDALDEPDLAVGMNVQPWPVFHSRTVRDNNK